MLPKWRRQPLGRCADHYQHRIMRASPSRHRAAPALRIYAFLIFLCWTLRVGGGKNNVSYSWRAATINVTANARWNHCR